jgi:hypothetical protein
MTIAPVRPARARLVVGWAAVLGTIPYLVLKFAWLSGSTVGVVAVGAFDDPSMTVLNLVTAGMDVVAVVVALAFTYGWGLRVPGFLVLGPTWIGTGLLTPIVLLLPTTLADIGRAPAEELLEPWVQPMVYSGFGWQGVTLAIAFVLYARARWPSVFTAAAFPMGVAAYVGSVAALVVATAHVVRGTPPDLVWGLLALAAAAGPLLRRVPFWVPLSLVWVGAGSMFAWGLWGLTNSVAATVLSTPVDPLDIVRVLTGLVLVGATWSAARPLCRAASAGRSRTRGDR